MARWLVELRGDPLDTEEYPYWFPDGDLHAIREGDAVFLAGPGLDALPDATAVRAAAAEAHREFSAVISLLWPDLRQSVLGAVTREADDGSRSAWVFPEGFAGRSKFGHATVTGGTARHQRTQAQLLLAAAQRNRHLDVVLMLWAAPEPSWPRLYRILEELEEGLGERVDALEFCTAAERTRFTRTANCPEVAGADARHRLGKSQPPNDPMSLPDARRFLAMLIEMGLRGAQDTPTGS